MNRTEHVKITLPLNLHENEKFPNVEFLLLDYSSSDGLEEWVRDNLNEYIVSGRLTYYHYSGATSFNGAHSRNMLFQLAKNDIICNVDADNIVYTEFTEYVLRQYQTNPDVIIIADFTNQKYQMHDIMGRFCCLKRDFLLVSGYDESIVGYGFEDQDLYRRIIRLGREKCVMDNINLVAVLQHDDKERVLNDWLVQAYYALFIREKGVDYELLILTSDKRYIRGTVVTTRYKGEHFTFGYDEGPAGEWTSNPDGSISLKNDDNNLLCLQAIDGQEHYELSGPEESIYLMRVTNMEDVGKAIMMYRMAANQEIYQKNINNKNLIINQNGFGRGVVYQNFDRQIPIDLGLIG
ncbi:glycosyltransferase family A protein [Chitinophaga qingshengii]|uniref:Glycosyltransferase family 2 protein n=1 Tax=Chitinophaga qingshengii TaxID=1569794 RepID=A0ABR7TFU2_9BACT|nr:glycosyltransferase family A protein [Chitinophaga qingshengii]MBC9929258.1 glycosyltransferase family 2 protein [Chitinophaga qingshengii]